MNKNITFIKYDGIEGYIEIMKHDVEPLNDPNCKGIDLYYDGKDIKAVLDYITNLQEENEKLKNEILEVLNDKRRIMTKQMLYGMSVDYQELLFQIDEEISKIIKDGE